MSDIGDSSLNELSLSPSSSQPQPQPSFSSLGPNRPSPSGTTSRPHLTDPFASSFSSSSSTSRNLPSSPPLPLHDHRRPSSSRIPSSPSQSDILSPSTSPPNLTTSPLRVQRTLSRSNSSPKPRRARANPSLDLGVSNYAKMDVKVGQDERRKLRRWIEAICVVNFDLDVGPVLESTVPDKRWHMGVGENIAFSSFPDSTLFTEGQTTWSFKINNESTSPLSPSLASSNQNHRPSTTSLNSSELIPSSSYTTEALNPNGGEGGGQPDGRLFGFAFFLQKRDNSIKRGFFQKSLVVLSPLPYPSFFVEVVAVLADRYFKEGHLALTAACKQIASWPAPSASASLSLPLFDTIFNVQLPTANQSSQVLQSISPMSTHPSPPVILASLPKTQPLRLLGHVLPSLWLIWECLIMAEPLLVIAPDPKTVSEIVWWLRDFIRPLPPSGDLRPYFHIHEASFPLLVNSHQPPPGVILGCTNPYFRQACQHWHHVLSTEKRVDAAPKIGQGSSIRTSGLVGKGDVPHGFKAKRKRQVDKDPALLKRLEAVVLAGTSQDAAANDELRFHFADLTEKFLVPLNRYFGSLIPIDLQPDSSNNLPPLKPFSTPAFLSHLKAHGHPLTFRSKVAGGSGSQAFYSEWLKSKNFGVWLTRRCGEAVEEMEKRARAAGWEGRGEGKAAAGGRL